jgi:hypothetical protein
MPEVQCLLPFRAADPKAESTAALTGWLASHPGWHTARQLAAALDLSDREVRAAAERSEGLVISGPGTPGYCHASHCSAEQISHAADTLLSQARRMIRRALRMRRRAHQIIR